MISQNVIFKTLKEVEDLEDHPPGREVAKDLKQYLESRVSSVSEPEGWRDTGWQLKVSIAQQELLINFALLNEPNQWMLQISPLELAYDPSFIGKLFGRAKKPASANADAVLELSEYVHAFLELSKSMVEGWCWDDFPAKANATKKPVMS